MSITLYCTSAALYAFPAVLLLDVIFLWVLTSLFDCIETFAFVTLTTAAVVIAEGVVDFLFLLCLFFLCLCFLRLCVTVSAGIGVTGYSVSLLTIVGGLDFP